MECQNTEQIPFGGTRSVASGHDKAWPSRADISHHFNIPIFQHSIEVTGKLGMRGKHSNATNPTALGETPTLLSHSQAKENGLSCPLLHGLENPCPFDKDARVRHWEHRHLACAHNEDIKKLINLF